MSFEVDMSSDPAEAFGAAHGFLGSDPVRHNVILTLLETRMARDTPGRYWWVSEGAHVAGFVFQSPVTFNATLTPMPPGAVEAVVDEIAAAGVELPGINGDAATAARFAGHWTEATKSAATPLDGERIYEARHIDSPPAPSGTLRQATVADSAVLGAWVVAFGTETDAPVEDPSVFVDQRVARGDLWVWDDDEIVAMAARTPPVAGVTRVQAVYTPPEHRRRGYAAALVSAISAAALDDDLLPILYTDLANPTSNSIYRRIGYQAVEEVIRYRFDA